MRILLFLSLVVIVLTACSENKEVSPKNESSIENTQEKENPVETKPLKEVEITLGEAVTTLIDTGKNRVSNIELACKSISGKELKPGEEFSFNGVVGRRSDDRGYKDAPIIFHGEKSYGTGGGVCQVSTTVYMAAVNAGMEITERHQHSESVAYAPGTDATVVYGEKDMKFKNTTDTTAYIYAWVQDGKVYGKIIKKEYEKQEKPF